MRRLILLLTALCVLLPIATMTGCGTGDVGSQVPWEAVPPGKRDAAQKKAAQTHAQKQRELEDKVLNFQVENLNAVPGGTPSGATKR